MSGPTADLDEKVRLHKEVFQQYLESVKKNTKVISEDVLKKIQSHLKGTTRGDKAVRRKVKKHSFFLMNYGSALDVVCVNKRVKGQSTKKTNTILRVAAVEDIFEILHRFHYIEGKHTGIRNLHSNVSREYDYIPRSVVTAFSSLCPTCSTKTTQTIIPPLKPIISTGFWSRLQIDLIDLRKLPDSDYQYIGHCVDHFTKYHILFAMKTKQAAEVASNLVNKVFAYFGLPIILHSDNGKEFVADIIVKVVEKWP